MLDDTVDLHYHKTPYQDADLRNVREIFHLKDKRFSIQGVGDVTNIVVANKSGNYVNIVDLTDMSSRVLLRKILRQEAKQAIHDRIVSPSARSFTSDQLQALSRYHEEDAPNHPKSEIFSRLLDEVAQDPDVARKPEKWVTDTAKELDDLAEGITRDQDRGLHM